MYGTQRHGSLTEAKPRQFTGHATADQHVWRSPTAKTAYQEPQGKKFSASVREPTRPPKASRPWKEASPLNSTFSPSHFRSPACFILVIEQGETNFVPSCDFALPCAGLLFFSRGPFFLPFLLFFFFFRHFFLFRILDKAEGLSIGRSFFSFSNVRRPLQLLAIPPRRLQLYDRKARRCDNQRFHCGGRP